MIRRQVAVVAATAVLAATAAIAGCTTSPPDRQAAPVARTAGTTSSAGGTGPTRSPSSTAAAPAPAMPAEATPDSVGSPGGTAPVASSSAPSPPLPASFGGGLPWPRVPRTAAPPAHGAVQTRRVAAVAGGGTLAAGLLLPRLDANAARPLIMTPCGRRVRLRASDVQLVARGSGGVLPKRPRDVLVLIDPGHGGPSDGAIGSDGSREADRVLDLALQAARIADTSLGRVYLTRTRDFDASLEFRVALGDALRADVAISVHLNAEPDGPLPRPGIETYGSVQDPQGRRLAGVVYEAQRRFLQRYPGPWLGDQDAGAKYRLGRRGGDYYGLLRRAHRPWVISESLFMPVAHDIALLDQAVFVTGLAGAIAAAATTFTTTRAPGSGWTKPYPRVANPTPPPGTVPPCVDPAR